MPHVFLLRCHGSLDTHPGCYHPGPGILPAWASGLCAVGLVVLIVVGAYFFVERVTRP